ncbi:MAG: site-2 protease family protein [Planctomycetota bacterium]|nr:site-2 protease family protein [Planctomycetota bacterium]
MSWSFRLGRVRGIDIRVHYTFLFLMAVVVMVGGGRTPAAFLSLVAGLVLLFTCVVLHELGHSVVAQAHGIRVRDITLLPIGGIARLEEVPEEPWTELKIAVAGPMVNLAIFILLTPFVLMGSGPAFLGGAPGAIGELVVFLWTANFMLMAFNLLPAFPLDGGRVLRAILAMRMDFLRATETAAKVGRVIAVGLVLIGLFGGGLALFGVVAAGGLIWLIVIGLFIMLAGANEVRLVKLRRWRRRFVTPEGAEIIPPGSPDDPPQEPRPGLLFDFGVTDRRQILEEFNRLFRRM